jgi:hypothetical protein
MSFEIPEYLIRMVRRQVPAAEVVHDTTPVLSFGDPQHAQVATLGINPSWREFVEDGRLLTGPQQRLATLESLGAQSTLLLTDAQILTVVENCASYFRPNRNPYRRWFDPLDKILQAGLGVSYYDGTACHLDLVQWATNPVWGELPDRAKQSLLKESLPHLRNQLKLGNIRLVVLNGRQVLDQVAASGLARLESSGTLRAGTLSCSLRTGEGQGVRFVGWSTNLQSSRGVTLEFKSRLARWLAAAQMQEGNMAENPDAPTRGHQAANEPSEVFEANGYVVHDTSAAGKAELFRLLKEWLQRSGMATIGNIGTYGRRRCIIIALDGGLTAELNSDTKRVAVQEFVRNVDADGPDVPWSVVWNRRGRLNKLAFRADGAETPGWYCYLQEPLSAPRKV